MTLQTFSAQPRNGPLVATETIQELVATTRSIRRHIIEMTAEAGSGHPGGSLSSVEILTALYFRVMNHKPDEPDWPDRDRFILSKGHATPVYYRTLAEAGYFPADELMTFRNLNSRLQRHPTVNTAPRLATNLATPAWSLNQSNPPWASSVGGASVPTSGVTFSCC